ncbi:RBPJ-interacting and tubulin-associated protein 1 [Discoglossus pictus]
MSLDLSITGHRTSLPQRKSRSAYRYKASDSYVDETLFGSHGRGADIANVTLKWNTAAPGQTPLIWSPGENKEMKANVSCKTNGTPVGTPRKKIEYRVKNRSPSYCDESLFGQRLEECSWEAPWVKKEEVRPRPLLWSPSPMPRPQNSKPITKQLPLRAVHPPDVSESVLGTCKNTGDFWRPPESDSDSAELSPSVIGTSRSAKPQRGTTGRETARSVTWAGRVTPRRGSGTIPERPPWK